MWLGEQITARGVGNGISLIIFAGIVANLPHALASTLELGRTGAISGIFIVVFIVISVGVIAFIVFMERAQRRILDPVSKASESATKCSAATPRTCRSRSIRRALSRRFLRRRCCCCRRRLPIFRRMARASAGSATITTYLAHGRPLYMLLYVALIVFFCFFYTAIVFNPTETADNLRKYGGFIPGIRPGKNTADYLDYVLTRLTVVGAAYLAAVCILPEIPDFAIFGAVLFRRNQPFDRRQRHDGYGGADPLAPARTSVRRADQEGEAQGPAGMNIDPPWARRAPEKEHRQSGSNKSMAFRISPPATCCAPRPRPAANWGCGSRALWIRDSWSPTASSSI